MGTIIGFRWKLYYDSCLLTEDDVIYDYEEEAEQSAQEEIRNRITDWKADNAWNEEYDSEDLFDIVVEEVIGEEKEEYVI